MSAFEVEVIGWLREVLPYGRTDRFEITVTDDPPPEAMGDLLAVTLRTVVYEGGSVRDIKEQQVQLLPVEVEPARARAYLEGWARAIPAILERHLGGDLDAVMPVDFAYPQALDDEAITTAADFERVFSDPEGPIRAWRATLAERPPVGDLSGTAPVASNPDLEAAIEASDSIDAYLVYGDWLDERGDPRGRMILNAAKPGSVARWGGIRSKHAPYLLGNLRFYDDVVNLSWRWGVIHSARIAFPDFDSATSGGPHGTELLRTLLALPSARFLRELVLGIFDFEGDNDYQVMLDVMAEAGPRPALRTLFIGDTNSEEQEISWTAAGRLATIRDLHPHLQDLKIRAGKMDLEGGLEYPRLRSLVIHSGGLAGANTRAIAAASLPALERLEVWFGQKGYGGDTTVDDLEPILSGDRLPRLTHLGLMNAEFTDALCDRIATAPILKRLRSLDLGMGVLTDDGARALAARAGAFAHLEHLGLEEGYLGEEGIRAVSAICPSVSTKNQREAYEYDGELHRYTAVGE